MTFLNVGGVASHTPNAYRDRNGEASCCVNRHPVRRSASAVEDAKPPSGVDDYGARADIDAFDQHVCPEDAGFNVCAQAA